MSLLGTSLLCKSYKSNAVVKEVSFSIERGEVFGLLGENGAGKTTTIKMLTGLTRPDSGNAFIEGIDIFKDKRRAKELMASVPQEINLDGEISVYDNLLIYAKLRKISRARERVRDIIYRYNLEEKSGERLHTLSGGQKRRVMIARAMLADAELIFMDEPTVGLDPSVRRDIWRIINSIKKSGKSVLLTTHYTEEAENLCDNIAIMHRGEIVRIGSPAELVKSAGAYALDIYNENHVTTRLFTSKEELQEYKVREKLTSFNVRSSRLEDLVIKTGEAG